MDIYNGDEIRRTLPLTVFTGRLGSSCIRTLVARRRRGILSIATADEVAKQGRLPNSAEYWFFSIRPIGVKRFQAVSPAMGNAARGSALLFGISRLALPAWDQGDGAEQSDSRPGYELAAGTRTKANSLHPSSREGHRSAGGGTRDCLVQQSAGRPLRLGPQRGADRFSERHRGRP
jgi:hypothetical protein